MSRKLVIILFFICLLFVVLFKFYDAEKPANQDGPQAPNFSFMVGDKTYELQDFKGKKIILSFWASWCRHCVSELPELLKIASSNSNVVLILMSQDREFEHLQKFLINFHSKNSFTSPHDNVFTVWDENKRIGRGIFGTMSYPETIIISPELKIIKKIIGKSSKENIEKLLVLKDFFPFDKLHRL